MLHNKDTGLLMTTTWSVASYPVRFVMLKLLPCLCLSFLCQAIPMLPPLLCEELCSLNPQVDRLTYSCIWRMNVDGTLVDEPAWFGRSVIRSCCKLDYQTAQHMIEGTILPENASSTAPELWDPNR